MSLKRYYISGLHPHIWEHPEGEMVYFEDYVTLWAENARLKAQVERLTAQVGADAIDREHGMCCDSSSEVTRLKAEVERLRASSFVTAVPVEQYERLRKAGDAMVLKIPEMMCLVVKAEEAVGLMNDWIAAKEGKPSA